MPKHKKRRMIEVAPAADYGPTMIRDCDGRLRAAWDGAAAGIEMADVPDIDRPDKRVTVRVARRTDPLIAILEPRRDGPGRMQFVAAEQFRRDSALADGVRGENEHLGVSGGPVGVGPTEVMIDAQGRVQRAWLAIRGLQNEAEVADVLRLVVLGWATLERIDAARRVRRHTGRTMLLVGLERLASHYGLTRRETSPLTCGAAVK
jgi:hypothetical protein